MLSPERIRRIRWRSRRGLLENDILLGRFLDAHEQSLGDADVEALDRLLDLTDPELLDLILQRTELPRGLDEPSVRRLLEALRAA
jgi:antitoxin CptB